MIYPDLQTSLIILYSGNTWPAAGGATAATATTAAAAATRPIPATIVSGRGWAAD